MATEEKKKWRAPHADRMPSHLGGRGNRFSSSSSSSFSCVCVCASWTTNCIAFLLIEPAKLAVGEEYKKRRWLSRSLVAGAEVQCRSIALRSTQFHHLCSQPPVDNWKTQRAVIPSLYSSCVVSGSISLLPYSSGRWREQQQQQQQTPAQTKGSIGLHYIDRIPADSDQELSKASDEI